MTGVDLFIRRLRVFVDEWRGRHVTAFGHVPDKIAILMRRDIAEALGEVTWDYEVEFRPAASLPERPVKEGYRSDVYLLCDCHVPSGWPSRSGGDEE